MILKFILVAFCVSFAVSNEDEKLFVEKSNECMKSLKIRPADLQKFMNTHPLVMGEGNLRCFPKCLLQAMKMMDEDGRLTEFKGHENEPGHECFAEIEAAHKDVSGDALCVKAFNFVKCVEEKQGHH